MKEAMELVFIPAPAMGHLISTIEMAKLLLQKMNHLSVSVIIMKLPFESQINSYIDSLSSKNYVSRLKFIQLSEDLPAFTEDPKSVTFFPSFIESHLPKVRDFVNEINNSASVRVAGLVVDMFCVSMMDVAHELGLPAYVFYTCGAAMLGLHLHIQSLRDDHAMDVTEFKDSDPDLLIPAYSKPFSVKLLPTVMRDKKGGSAMFLDIPKRIREAKGILVNTVFALEPYALESLSKDENVPPVYPVGPVLNPTCDNLGSEIQEILTWLDDQPASSVVFLCFGSAGCFSEPQVKEIAYALERSGYRFLWSLRRPPSKDSPFPTNYNNMEEVLPEGFLERTKRIGKVIGWAPQAAVLAHPAVGGFVSHCGWNSILESVWFGVAMATWPMYAEQQANAFLLVNEIGIGVEVKMDYIRDAWVGITEVDIVNAEEIERGIRNLMDNNPAANHARIKAEELKDLSRKAMEEGGSSFNHVDCFLEQAMNNLM